MELPGIAFTDRAEGIKVDQLTGFFVGWTQPPSRQLHLSVLRRSDSSVIALDTETESVVGFVTALSDGLISAHISLLEVLPGYQRQGIGTELVRRLLDSLRPLYAIDALCDDETLPFYRRLGVTPVVGVAWREAAAMQTDSV